MKINKCISCGCDSFSITGSSGGFSEGIGKRTFGQEAFSILKCSDCGLYYKDNVLSDQLFIEYYNSFDFENWAPETAYITEQVVAKYLSSKSKLTILDYGCSSGRFLSKFVKKHTCFGYDIDARALKIAAGKGIHPLVADELSEYSEKFDIIVLSDVFEHSTQPTNLISSLLAMLNKNGILIITTGYADASVCKYDLANFWYFQTVQHVCMMGQDYINYLQAKFQIYVLNKIVCSHYKSSFKQRIFHQLRFDIFKLIDSNRDGILNKIISYIPYVNKITKWKKQPYHPYSKDHVVLFLQKKIED